jgi:hypothetical protein
MTFKYIPLAVITILAVPFFAGAQSTGLSDAIRAEILKDPRAADIPQAQIDAMVSSLAQTAAAQGITESDITWRPATSDTSRDGSACGFFCQVNRIFGFEGDDYTIPFGLGITSALLILFMSMMWHRHHVHGIEPTVDSIHTHGEHPAPKA